MNSLSGSLRLFRSLLILKFCLLVINIDLEFRISSLLEFVLLLIVNLFNLVKEGSVNKINIFYKKCDKENSF